MRIGKKEPREESRDNLYESLERIFHEPNRLSIMSALCASTKKGLTFNELKEQCGLTDGNLNRHLRALEDAGAIRIEKTFLESKPRTTIYLSTTGLKRFSDYLSALAGVLKKAEKALPVEGRKTAVVLGQVVRA